VVNEFQVMVSQFIFSQVRRRRWSVSFKYWSVSFSQVRRRWSVTVSRRGQSAPGVCYSLSVVSRQRGYRLWQRARLSVSVPVSVSAISVSASQFQCPCVCSLHVVVCRCCCCRVSVCSACGQSVLTLSCVDAAAVSQCVQHADSQSSRCRENVIPKCMILFIMR